MGRPKRIQYAGACYLVVLQGNNRQDLFLSNQDRRQFLNLLRQAKERHGLSIYAYCLLAGEALLLLETSRPNLSAAMQAFNTQYTKYYGAAHGTVGHVLQGRYKAYVVDPETHLAETSRYVHLACARGAAREKPWRYQWSSCAAYAEAENREPLVETARVLKRFGNTRLKQTVRYLGYIKERLREAGEQVLPVVSGVAIGGEAFATALAGRSDAPAPKRQDGSERARQIIAELAARHGVAEEKLLGRLQWREVSAARREAIHRVWKEAGLGVSELARLFSRTPSAISQLIRAVEGGGTPSLN